MLYRKSSKHPTPKKGINTLTHRVEPQISVVKKIKVSDYQNVDFLTMKISSKDQIVLSMMYNEKKCHENFLNHFIVSFSRYGKTLA